MSDSPQPTEPKDGDTKLEELNDEGAGLGATPEEPTTFEPEEPQQPAKDGDQQ